ncbi:metallophosphoesterase [Ideonella sp.]|uniref:metallophosphoesterase n=1 Tax=Ideonella sp. TaxID=1929293 RepID=UPI003BB73DF1
MRLLHLSDIHFRSPICLTPHLDRDRPFRSRLEHDIEKLCGDDGIRVDVILVGGDIAYKADPVEYGAAKAWLLHIAKICGCRASNILTVPGNHDVNWATCKKEEVLEVQRGIADGVNNYARDGALLQCLSTEERAKALFEPIEAYNDFAAQFGCQLFHTHPFWERTLELSQGVKLRIHGLTSTFISGAGERDAAPGRLFLGSCQTVLDPDPDIVSLVLCHHPPSWFLDANEAENIIDGRAKLQFFGHEHDQRCRRVKEYMRFMAGAVNPARDEHTWRPGYNLVDLAIVGTGAERQLDIRAQLRAFQLAPSEFYVALQPSPKETLWTHRIEIPAPIRPVFAAEAALELVAESLNQPPHQETKMAAAVHATMSGEPGPQRPALQVVLPVEAKVSEPSTDDLVFRFWQLRTDVMRDIALDLGLITEVDLDLKPHQRYFKAMEVARQRGLLVALAREIERYE